MREAHRQAARQIWWLHNPRHTAWHLYASERKPICCSSYCAALEYQGDQVILIERARHRKLLFQVYLTKRVTQLKQKDGTQIGYMRSTTERNMGSPKDSYAYWLPLPIAETFELQNGSEKPMEDQHR